MYPGIEALIAAAVMHGSRLSRCALGGDDNRKNDFVA
jgi:hypothetical protein